MAIQVYTVQEFEDFIAQPENTEKRFELINGEIVEKMPTEKHSLIAGNIYSALREYARPRNLGRPLFEVRYEFSGGNIRIPDISFTLAERSQPVVDRGPVSQLPDLVVEVKSPDDAILKLREKADFYLEHSVRLVWLVYPDPRIVEVYTPDGIEMLAEGHILTGEPVLPDFSIPVSAVFEE